MEGVGGWYHRQTAFDVNKDEQDGFSHPPDPAPYVNGNYRCRHIYADPEETRMKRNVSNYEHFKGTIENAEYYKNAPAGTVQKMAYDLEPRVRQNIMQIIEIIEAYEP